MIDDFLSYYDRELVHVRRLAAEFAEQHPKIAGRLRVTADAVEDPHVARLIEAFSFLTARIRQKLDDEFPELTNALVGVLYPHYQAPIPSMAIAQFTCQPDLTEPHAVPRGTEIEAEPVDGEVCRFRTCHPAMLWPIVLEAASLTGRPVVAPVNPRAPGALATLRLTLRCRVPDMTFARLGVDSLQFYLRGQTQQVFPLYQLIFNNTVSIALADSASDPAPVILPASMINPVGFGRDEGMLPYSARSLPGYRLLTEYFAFPEKFVFFEITGLSAKTLVAAGNKLEIFFYFDLGMANLERNITAENFALGCVPVVNLFRQRAEAIPLTHMTAEYRVVPDVRRPAATEIYSIDQVTATSPKGESRGFRPFYSTRHDGADGSDRYWYATRKPSARSGDSGTEVFVSLVDLAFDPRIPDDWVLSVDTTCINRDIPARLPYGGGRPALEFVDGRSAVARIACLTPPTATLRPRMGQSGRWRLISHLTLNYLSLVDGAEGAEALREMLRLYDFRDSSDTRAIIDSVLTVASRRAVARAPSRDMGPFCRGIDVAIEFDEKRFTTSGIFLLAMVLERFLGLYCSINSFSRLTARIKGRMGILRQWPPRAGNQALL
jgi:type VI secretion system protein ImpG